MKKIKVEKRANLKDFIADYLNISKNKAKELIDSRTVFVNNRRVWISSYVLNAGDIVEIPDQEKTEKWSIEKNIIYEDKYIIGINKPPFLESESKKGSVEDILRSFKKDKKIKAVHRLDRETSGILLFAKNSNVFERFKKAWRDKKIKKEYFAISHGKAEFKKKVVNLPVDGKYAKSFIYTVKTSSDFTLFRVEIPTGRKHQIRIHLSKIRYPIVGDKLYGLKDINSSLLKNVKRQMLHSYSISFIHPYTKERITIKAEIFPDFKNFGKRIRLL